MQAAVLVITVGTGIWALSMMFGSLTAKSEQTARELLNFQTDMRTTVAEIRGEVRRGIQDIRADMTSLPDQRARLDQAERRIAEGEARDVAQDARIGLVERQAIETRARLDNLSAASAVTLPGAPGVRSR